MVQGRLLTIAKKELFDHLKSRRFLLIFGILLVVAIVGMIGGITEYNKTLDNYNKQQSTINSPLSSYIAEKPSILSVFASVATYLVFVGAILGIAMGFDLVSKEKESKSLKILLSHPVYRDEVINGKALGSIAALTGALFVVLFIALATLLVYGIVPDAGELALIGIFAAVSFLLIFSYFAIALFMSTTMDESGPALIYTIIVFIILSVLVPTLANDTVMESVVGSQPEIPQELLDQMQQSVTNTTGDNSVSLAISNKGGSGAWDEYNERMQAYWEKRQVAKDTFSLFSPTMNYQSVTSALTSTMSTGMVLSEGNGVATVFSVSSADTVSVDDILGKTLANIMALLLFPTVFFGLAYLRFMRLDVR